MDKAFWAEINELVDRTKRRRQEGKSIWDSVLRSRYGSSIGDRFGSAAEAIDSLYSSEKLASQLALLALSIEWKLDTDSPHLTRIRQLALTDPDSDVRAAALQALGAILRGTLDSEAGKILASVVRDESEKTACREAAYYGLRYLSGCDDKEFIDFPASVDWGFVDRWLSERGGKGQGQRALWAKWARAISRFMGGSFA